MVSRWLWPGNRTFLQVVSWWIVAFLLRDDINNWNTTISIQKKKCHWLVYKEMEIQVVLEAIWKFCPWVSSIRSMTELRYFTMVIFSVFLFQAQVRQDRIREQIRPYLPPIEERAQIKEEYMQRGYHFTWELYNGISFFCWRAWVYLGLAWSVCTSCILMLVLFLDWFLGGR